MSVYDNPMIFNLYSGAAKVFSAPFGIIPIEERQRIARYNSTLSFYIFNEENGRHHRELFHAFLNGENVASIYLDDFEVDYLNSKVKSSDKRKIEEWVRSHIDDLRKIKLDEQGKYDIPFIGIKEGD